MKNMLYDYNNEGYVSMTMRENTVTYFGVEIHMSVERYLRPIS